MLNRWLLSATLVCALVSEALGFIPDMSHAKRTLKQFNPRLATRTSSTTSDVCGVFDGDIGSLLNSRLGTSVGSSKVSACVCRSQISSLASENSACSSAASTKGSTAVLNEIYDIFDNDSSTCKNKQTCTYPENSEACGTTSNVCAFSCTNGYTLSGSSCACNGYVCNGVCQSAKCATVSGRGLFARGSYDGPLHDRSASYCPKGETMCGYDLRKSTNSLVTGKNYECVDTTSNSKSCGGCTIPLLYGGIPTGKDCTAIANVVNADCIEGGCYVRSCSKGYAPSADESKCVSK